MIAQLILRGFFHHPTISSFGFCLSKENSSSSISSSRVFSKISLLINPSSISLKATIVGLSSSHSTIGSRLVVESCLALLDAINIRSNLLGIFSKQSSTVIRAMLYLLNQARSTVKTRNTLPHICGRGFPEFPEGTCEGESVSRAYPVTGFDSMLYGGTSPC